ncbi:MAG: hypothetical protein EU543_05460 [Promethearchaeota archaeon]|nr:MAG: hypothetical protein EU543_05460 [Candidatus Lokiarchaeota archaeon]
MNILIASDGKYGDRAANTILRKFPATEFFKIRERPLNQIIDEVDLNKEFISKIKWADLLIIYIRHPDIVMEICEYGKPTIIAVDFGEGFLRQVKKINPKIVMPKAMCNVHPNTGIPEIDTYFTKYGFPTFKIMLDHSQGKIPIIKNIELLVESPCGVSREGLKQIIGKKLVPETITSYGVFIRHECREPISVMLKHDDIADSSASLHIINLLEALEREYPNGFIPNTPLGEYTNKRRQEYKCLKKTADLFRN